LTISASIGGNAGCGHGGGAPGMNAILRVYPVPGQSVIVLCNLDSPSAFEGINP
jgi:hypothetical protein